MYDVGLLFTSRAVRLFAFGFLSVVLALYLDACGLGARAIGLVLTFALVGDAGFRSSLRPRPIASGASAC